MNRLSITTTMMLICLVAVCFVEAQSFAPVSSIGTSKILQSKTPPPCSPRLRSSPMHMLSSPQLLNTIRGGAAAATASKWSLAQVTQTPSALFHSTLLSLAIIVAATKILQYTRTKDAKASEEDKKPASVKAQQAKFLAVFWMLRMADWLQGPYFFQVYSEKIIGGVQASMGMVSKLFLTGFASTALFGPSVGRAADQYGRKKATLAFTIIYSLGALSTKSNLLRFLFAGRVLSGIGTSLLFSAPEAWLVGASQQNPDDKGKYLGETFSLAYAGDSVVAILAGQMAGLAAQRRGATGPFELSSAVLLMGGLLASFLWKENKAPTLDNEKPSIAEAIQVVKKDPKIMLVGGIQSLFEAAMYIFVLQWPPAIAKAVAAYFGESAATPYGAIFSCFMACCLLGSTLFGQLAKMAVPTENSTSSMLLVATLAMSMSTVAVSKGVFSLATLVAAFFIFEGCVGMYFPSIGTLRSRYVPDSHRSVIMNLFGIPLNVLVVSVFLTLNRLGIAGALSISSGALGVATACSFALKAMVKKEETAK